MLASARDSLLCTWGGGEVSAWDLGDGRLVARTDEARIVKILASALGCVIRRADEIVVLDGRRTQRIELDSPALAMGLGDGATLLVATADAIVEVGSDRRPHEIRSVPGGEATAVAGGSDRVAIGYRDGNLELLDRRRGPATVFEQTPPSPVTRVTMGPAGTVLAGFADGSVGMWSASGQRLRHTRLHGPVQHLALYDQRVHAVTALGRHRTLDLGVLYEDRCTLLREVWSRVPVVWEEGRAVVRERPMQHPCAVTSAP
jgi:hypothetical protein